INVTGPYKFFGNSTVPKTPADTDGSSTELGMRFTSSVNAFVTGVRFYKGSGNTGTHVGSLWNSAGTNLASVTFSGEPSPGWQTPPFPPAAGTPAGTDYVISYYAPTGHSAADSEVFAYDTVVRPPLTAPMSTASKPNGVYRSGSTGFPTDTFKGGNY